MDVQRVVLRSVARDGSVMIRKVRGFDNDFRFALQVLESDLLDTDYNHKLPNGNIVRMGIELDAFERPVAYHILNGHEGDDFGMKRPTRRDRVPADESSCLSSPSVRTGHRRALAFVHVSAEHKAGYEEG